MRTAPKLKKCSERLTDSCSTETDGCCAIIPCTYCLTWEVYGHDNVYGKAEFSGGTWTGTIAGASFVAYWDRDIYGVCHFIVTLGGIEILRESCYGAVNCKDSSGSAGATIGYDSGTLKWTKHEAKSLPLKTVDGCRVNFCGNCDCTCKKLCYRYSHGYAGDTCGGLLEETNDYTCTAPSWSGSILCDGLTIPITIDLVRDEYTGGCLLELSTPSEIISEAISDCKSLGVVFHLYDGSTLTVACEECGGCVPQHHPCECRRDSDAIFRGYMLSSTSPCPFSPITASSIYDPIAPAPGSNPWLAGDCVNKLTFLYRAGFSPPLCPGAPGKTLYIVLKQTDAPTPGIDNDIVKKLDMYLVIDGRIVYDYSACCVTVIDNTASARNFLVWVNFPEVDFGDAKYSIWWYNQRTALDNGNCGVTLP